MTTRDVTATPARVAALPDESELDIPGADPESEPVPVGVEGPAKRTVDRVLASIVTCAPPLAFAFALYLHFAGIVRITWIEIALMLLFQALAVTGVEVGYHRLFSHGSFKASRGVKITLAVLGSLGFQGPVIWWAAVHRKHHRYSDRPHDPHSNYIMPYPDAAWNKGLFAMVRGFVHSHVGWIWTPASTRFIGWSGYVRNLYRDKDLFKIHLMYPYILASGFILPGILGGLLHGSWLGVGTGVLWGGFVRVFFMNHLSYWGINSLSHSIGPRPYLTADRSTNSVAILFAVPTLGQSYHNNHHAFPYSARMQHRWYELDLGWWLLRTLERFGQVSNLKQPTAEAMDRKRIKRPSVSGPAAEASASTIR
ncbi:MAG TPA: fatty acid desaturase [Polyangiales bacterium]|nr:fatty acid desaturase [Polyangiales bacterium]